MKPLLLFFLSFILIVFIQQMYSQNNELTPKREYRAVLLATAFRLDWPPDAPVDIQKKTLRNIIHKSKEIGLNTIVFQVVARGDAMYPSARLPWAPWLTGTAGEHPGWDPLAFLIKKANALGIEVHAGYNVFRVGDSTPVSSIREPLHVVYAHPEWIENVDDRYYINPGYPDAREWLIGNVLELVENYDIDAIRFDYIRYPSGGFPEDWKLFGEYNPNNKSNLSDWRRDNINEFVRNVYPAIKEVKPWVKVGSTPIGHYYPAEYPTFVGYSDAYQDSRRWLQEGVHDFLTPQLYYDLGENKDKARFEVLAQEWIQESSGRHIYIGMGPFKDYVYAEIPQQIDTVRAAGGDGQIYFRYSFITSSLFDDRYKYPAIPPIMDWDNLDEPSPVASFSFSRHPDLPISILHWEDPEDTLDYNIRRYALYRFDSPTIFEKELEDPSNIYTITGERSYLPASGDNQDGNFFVVTRFNRNNVESQASTVIEIPQIETKPVLLFPFDNAINQTDTLKLIWEYTPDASFYELQVYQDELFASKVIVDITGIQDTIFSLTGINGQETYYWRARARNAAGKSEYSDIYNFSTGFPYIPFLSYPAHGEGNISVLPTLSWYKDSTTTSYQLQVAASRGFTPSDIVVDMQEIADTVFVLTEELEKDYIYFWRVKASNEYGSSNWSEIRGFRTQKVTSVDDVNNPSEYSLSQNYPNPFNPMTYISFTLPVHEYVTLIVHDIIGREILTIVNEKLSAGQYTVEFNANNLPSGLYIYRINTSEYVESKLMMFIK